MLRRQVLASALCLPAIRASAQAGVWPNRPVRVVVPFPPGGGADGSARLLSAKMLEALVRPVTNAMADAGLLARLQVQGFEPALLSGPALTREIDDSILQWADVLKRADVTLE
jgi:tripartite-type tricarboxylate transporter receptor subunit TctC